VDSTIFDGTIFIGILSVILCHYTQLDSFKKFTRKSILHLQTLWNTSFTMPPSRLPPAATPPSHTIARSPRLFQQVRGIQRPLAAVDSDRSRSVEHLSPLNRELAFRAIHECVADLWHTNGIHPGCEWQVYWSPLHCGRQLLVKWEWNDAFGNIATITPYLFAPAIRHPYDRHTAR